MRAEVVEQHTREQNRHRRAPAAAAPEPTSQISPEFLDALPPEIRIEVIMQEALQNSRRSRANAPAEPQVPPADASAGFFASLSDELRGVMLLGQPNGLPPSDAPTNQGSNALHTDPKGPTAIKRPTRETIQLLDKPGIATLVRLLFFPEAFKQGHLFRILVNLCENTHTRTDLLSLLVSVVQDGSGDLPAVDRSFQQMSLRAMTTPKSTAKAKALDSPAPVSTGLFAQLQSEHVPTFISQRCFEALTYIVGANARAVTYFLTEHEQAVGLKKTPAKKGKGKEKFLPQTEFPIVILLGLLDRPLLVKAPGMMESLTSLLATITKPLSSLNLPDRSSDSKTETTSSVAPTSGAALAAPQAEPSVQTGERSFAEITIITPLPSGLPKTPVIPPSALRLIVNALTLGDCPSRTFSQTLITMQNLSSIPDGKEVILQEIRTRSQELGEIIQQELRDLADELEDETRELGSMTLTKFSPPSSRQAQLLRLLKTIEYLHLNKVDSDPPVNTMSNQERAVGQMHESFDFDPMWEQLGHCMSMVEKRGTTDQIAMVLLPLVEALMVVCKYRGRVHREIRSPSLTHPTPSDSKDLFVSFTTSHRKVLNAIVRNNPALLSGSFSLLVRNPRVLEFDNKRNWFFQKLKRRRDHAISSGVLHLNVRRQYVFEDSFHALRQRSGDEVKYGKLSVKFYNEDGIDAGGVTREWYSVLAQQVFDPNFGKLGYQQILKLIAGSPVRTLCGRQADLPAQQGVVCVSDPKTDGQDLIWAQERRTPWILQIRRTGHWVSTVPLLLHRD